MGASRLGNEPRRHDVAARHDLAVPNADIASAVFVDSTPLTCHRIRSNRRGPRMPTALPTARNNTPHRRLPPWLRVPAPGSPRYVELKRIVEDQGLSTVCQEAHCPNIGECWGQHGTATFMILGETCTRNCAFCAVKTGTPLAADRGEPVRVAEAIASLGLRHAVVTSVTRDDLPDGADDQTAGARNDGRGTCAGSRRRPCCNGRRARRGAFDIRA